MREFLNNDNGNKLDALRKKEAALRQAIAQEQARQQKARMKLQKREFAIIGETLCTYAAQSPEFHAGVEALLAEAVTVADEPVRKFLAGRGWL